MNQRLCCVFALAFALAGTSCGARVRRDAFRLVSQPHVVQTPLINEASGLVASRHNPGVIWVHNDSGDVGRLFALDTQARLLGICTIVGAEARDWEDIAIGPGPDPNQPYLYIGDIGDNRARHGSVKVYRVPEPDLKATSAFGRMRVGPVATIELTYPDGPRDAETLLVDPQTKDIYLLSKRDLFCKVYRAAWPQSISSPTQLEHVAVLPWALATGGDVSPDGREVIVRSPYNASLWVRPEGEPLWRAFKGPQVGLPLAKEPQGEAITFDTTGQGYFTLSEKANPSLYYFERVGEGCTGELSDTPTSP